MYPVDIWCPNDVVSTSMRRNHVASTLIRRHFYVICPLGNVSDKGGICSFSNQKREAYLSRSSYLTMRQILMTEWQTTPIQKESVLTPHYLLSQLYSDIWTYHYIVSKCRLGLQNTVELRWLEHLWNHENIFETGVVQANECYLFAKSGSIIGISFL